MNYYLAESHNTYFNDLEKGYKHLLVLEDQIHK